MKKGQTANLLIFIVIVWTTILIGMSFVGRTVIEQNNVELPLGKTSWDDTLSYIWDMMTFQAEGVEWWISLMLDGATALGVMATILILRGI